MQWDMHAMHAEELFVVHGFKAPVSISRHDNRYYISNLGDRHTPGYIDIADQHMNIIHHKFIDNLKAPRGTVVFRGILYVCDTDNVIGFDLRTGRQVAVYDFSASGTKALSAIVAVDNRTLLVAAQDINMIFSLNKRNRRYTPFMQVDTPVDICLDELKRQLFVASAGNNNRGNGRLGVINLKGRTPTYTPLSDYTGHIRGIYLFSNLLYFTDWMQSDRPVGELKSIDISTRQVRSINHPWMKLNRPGAVVYDFRLRTFYITNQEENLLYRVSGHD